MDTPLACRLTATFAVSIRQDRVRIGPRDSSRLAHAHGVCACPTARVTPPGVLPGQARNRLPRRGAPRKESVYSAESDTYNATPQGRASSSSGWLDRRPAVCVHPGLGSPSSEAALETCRELAPRDTHVWGLTETRRLGSGRAHARGCPVMWARTQDLLRAVPRGTFIPSMQFGYGTAQGVTPGLAAGEASTRSGGRSGGAKPWAIQAASCRSSTWNTYLRRATWFAPSHRQPRARYP